MKRRANIVEVAKLAGVSVSTVSRVINKSAYVSKSNRLKVESAVNKLGFKPDIFAQRLASGKGIPAIGLVIPRYENVFYSFYALELIRGVGSACDANKLDLFLHVTGGTSLSNLSSLSGIIFADIIGNRDYLTSMLSTGVPCVVVNNIIADLEVDCIAIDNKNGAREAVEYLINLGHHKIAHIAGDLNIQSASERLEGYKAALVNKGIELNPNYIIATDYSRQKARDAVEQLLNLKERPTAIFIASDSMALEAMGIILKYGLKVPEDISIIGFDDNPEGLYAPVSLTTVKQPLIKLGQMAVEKINLLVKEKERRFEKISLPCELVLRDSCYHL